MTIFIFVGSQQPLIETEGLQSLEGRKRNQRFVCYSQIEIESSQFSFGSHAKVNFCKSSTTHYVWRLQDKRSSGSTSAPSCYIYWHWSKYMFPHLAILKLSSLENPLKSSISSPFISPNQKAVLYKVTGGLIISVLSGIFVLFFLFYM